MKTSITVIALISNVSAELGVWNDQAYCNVTTELDTMSNSMFSLEDCSEWCQAQDLNVPYGGNLCCDFEGWTSGLSDCTLYGNATGGIPYTNYGVYGNTEFNFYASMNFTSGANSTFVLPTPGQECVNDDSTGDVSGDTCSQYYDGNFGSCGEFDTATFSAWNQCCECGGGQGTFVDDAACINDDSTGDVAGDTCSEWYDMNGDQLNCGNFDTEDFNATEQCCVCGGGVDYSVGIVENEVADLCVNDDSVSDEYGDTCSGWYDAYPSGCGTYDDDDFTATNACCVCGGGSFADLPVNTGEPIASGCVNDDSEGDSSGDTCSMWYDTYPSGCGSYDTETFSASTFCCTCGGGNYDGASVTTAPASCTSDLSTSDAYGDSCTWYDLYQGENCGGTWDTDSFEASGQCCGCGGGSY